MSGGSETLAEIVAEMRGMGNYQRYSGDHAHALADRIEAAAIIHGFPRCQAYWAQMPCEEGGAK